jgi:hypothetical protein
MKHSSTHPQNLNLPLNLGHSNGSVDISPPYELDSDLLAPLTMETKLDFAELALAQGLKEQIGPELGYGPPWVCGGKGHGSWVRVDVCVGWLLLHVLGG